MITIKKLAKDIGKAGFKVEVSRGYCNTDRKIGRLRHPGNGRYASRIKVYGNYPLQRIETCKKN